MGRIGLWVLIGLLLAGSLANVDTVQAQLPAPELTLEVAPHGTPVVPGPDAVVVPFTVGLTCEPGTVDDDITPLTVTINVEPDAGWAAAISSPVSFYFEVDRQNCLVGASQEQSGEVEIVFSYSAPAGEIVTFTMTARASDIEPAEVSWEETVAPYLRTKAQLEKAIHQTNPGGTVALALEALNFGNAPNLVTLHPNGTPSDGYRIVLPDPATVPADTAGTMEVRIKTPGTSAYVNERVDFTFDVVFSAVDDPELTERHSVSAVIQVQGIGAMEAPVSPLPLLIALFGLLVWMGRGRWSGA